MPFTGGSWNQPSRQAGSAVKCCADAVEEDLVMLRGARRGAGDAQPVHVVGKQRAPVIGLLPAHRPAIDHGQPLDAEDLIQEAALQHDVVADGDLREPALVQRVGRVRRRCRESVRHHVRDDDEITRRIEDTVLADQPVDIAVLRAVGGRVEDDVRFIVRQFAVGLIDQLRRRQGNTALQDEVLAFVGAGVGHSVLFRRHSRASLPSSFPGLSRESRVQPTQAGIQRAEAWTPGTSV